MEYVLETNAVEKQYRYGKALNGLSMRVPKGAIYGLVGRNGAGKTTLIRLICGLQEPSAGEYSIFGVKHSDKAICVSRRRMGAVIERPAIYSDLTAEENLIEQCHVLGVSSFGELPRLLKLVGLEDAGRKIVKHFSLGMKQRLGIAVALVGSPDFLVLDEPTNGLDPQGTLEIRELIMKLNRDHRMTVLISSHLLDELSKVATHYGFISDGCIVKEISATELEDTCRKSMRMEVSDMQSLTRVLNDMGADYRILDSSRADIFSELNITEVVVALFKESCEVISIQSRSEGLEGYFISLLGGGSDA